MKVIRFIGDVHGKYERYKNIIRNGPPSIQVGDMGVGFRKTSGPRIGELYSNPPHYLMEPGNHRFIRGNHDNPEECKKHSQWIADGSFEGDMMFCGGAVSVDRDLRTPGYTYWEDEELSYIELDKIVGIYLDVKPRIMVTHDAPEEIALQVQNQSGRMKLDFPSRSRQAFSRMLNAHQPKLWLFGHWHRPITIQTGKTKFRCLAELEYKDIDIEGKDFEYV